ncbi:MAG: HEAT repeat domain-containing protein [Acidobacteria bacterium]|nr:HEAT repeat domain-containing protein [Acidobacteriota bacterium]
MEGADLRAKLKEALRLRGQRRSATNSWVAYSFDVKPGMAIDAVVTDSGGQTFALDLATGSLPYETRNVAVFLMYAPDGRTVERGELYNLDRRRNYEGYPVYWLGHAGIEESLSLLQEAVLSARDGRTAKRLTEAAAVHNHRSSETALRNILYSAADERARMTAINWLGRVPDGQTYLIETARDERLGLVLRKRAVAALVEKTPAPRSLSALSEVAENPRESAEMQIEAVRAIGLSNTEGAVPVLIRIAKSHPSARVRQEAVKQLGRRNEESAQKFLRELGSN